MYDDIIQLLFLDPIRSKIELIEVHRENSIPIVEIKLKKEQLKCPICESTTVFHSYRLKQIKYSLSSYEPYIIKYHSRRYQCRVCKKYISEHNPFSSRWSSISNFTKHSILESLKGISRTFTDIAQQHHISIQEVINIFDKSISAKRRSLGQVMCIDEIFISRRHKYKYACVLYDFNSSKIIDVITTRHKMYLIEYFSRIKDTERQTVKIVVMDMWESYREVISMCFPRAAIAVDSFHIITHLNRAMDRIRIDTMNRYRIGSSDPEFDDMYYYMLKKFAYFFLKDLDELNNFKPVYIKKLKTYWDKEEVLKYLLSIDDDLARCFKLKERYRYFNKTADFYHCDEELDDLIQEFINNPVKEFRAFGRTLINWKQEIKNSFLISNKRRVSNGPIESTNSKIKSIIKASNGIRKFSRLRNKIMYSINRDLPIQN
jgi:transposase